jgi:UDP-N-acetylmuramate--alanine ligase
MPGKKINEKNDQIFALSDKKLHFVGIGGISMASLARLALLSGARVSGSDRDLGDRTHALATMGATICAGHSKENLPSDSDLVIYSGAIGENNPELVAAKEYGIPAVTRASFLGGLMMEYTSRIGISGTHGKSTATAMLDAIFTLAGKNPTTLAGEYLPATDSSLRVGGKETLIYEACEYKDAFRMFSPTIAVALNLEMDHVDYYKDEKSIKASYAAALSKASDFVLINEDDENLFKIKKKITSRVVTFGSKDESDYAYSIISFSDVGYSFSVKRRGKTLGIFRLPMIGAFNVVNAAAAVIVAIECGIKVPVIVEALKGFTGIKRRLERVGAYHGRAVIYDYAHHPTEVRASINTVRMAYPGEVTVVFRPHTYTRTEYFWREFRSALELADHIIITDIYPAREAPIPGVTAENLAKSIGPRAIYSTDHDIIDNVDLHTHGTIIVMGAGDLEDVKNRLIKDDEAQG